jgi:hypothetical protein
MHRSPILCAALALSTAAACTGWNEIRSRQVERAGTEYEAGRPDAAQSILADYLRTCPSADGAPPDDKLNAQFDHGLALFGLLESYGGTMGERAPELDGGNEIACAMQMIETLLAQTALSPVHRIEALYLKGNLNFLLMRKPEAVRAYEQALELGGGAVLDPQGSEVLRNAAFNRALALTPPPESDASADGANDSSADSSPPDGGASDGSSDGSASDGSSDGSADGSTGDSGSKDSSAGDAGGSDGGADGSAGDAGIGDSGGSQGQDGGEQDSGNTPPPEESNDGGLDAGASELFDERVLGELDKTPSLQREFARRNQRRTRPLEDK